MANKLILGCVLFLFVGCTSYTHLMESKYYNAPQKSMGAEYYFAGTHSFDLLALEKAKKYYEDANGNISTENKRRLDSLFVMQSPTYYELKRNVEHSFGKEATFANIVWDVKHTQFLSFKGQKIVSVTFDLYLQKK